MQPYREKYPKLGKKTNPNSQQAAIKYDWHSALLRLEGAYAHNTIRAYRTDFTIFEAWCRKEGHVALPASPETVANFVLAQSASHAAATVGRRRASISKVHRLLKLTSPITSEEVTLAARKMFRLIGRRQAQALGLTRALKEKLLAACPNDTRGLRDRALIATGYDTLCRRAELVELQIEDLTTRSDGSGTILVRKSKADQLARGRLAYLSSETIAFLDDWFAASDLKTGPIFQGIHGKSLSKEAIHAYSVARILKDRAADAGLDSETISQLSGHSMRVGAAQDMASAGIDLGAIMHAGGWKSPDMVMRYIEHMDIQKSGMAKLYKANQLID